jgi:hypothetical protein
MIPAAVPPAQPAAIPDEFHCHHLLKFPHWHLLYKLNLICKLWLLQLKNFHNLKIPGADRVFRDKKAVDHNETSIKRKCKSLRRKAQAVITKMTPGAFSPQQGPPSASGSKR